MPIEILKTMEPITLVIYGGDVTGKDQTFSITDDYCTLQIKVNESIDISIDSSGFAFVSTLEQFKEWNEESLLEDDEAETFIIENFTGSVELAIFDKGKNVLPSDADLQDYIMHQTDDFSDAHEPTLTIKCPSGLSAKRRHLEVFKNMLDKNEL